MIKELNYAKIQGSLMARTPRSEEIELPQWTALIESILDLARGSSGVVALGGKSGSGRTTFMSLLSESGSKDLDVIKLAPAMPIAAAGWLIEAIAPWLSSEKSDIPSIQRKLAGLAEDHRPLLVCVDGAEFIPPGILADDIGAFMNLCDNCGLKTTIVTMATMPHSLSMIAEKSVSGKVIHHQQIPGFTPAQLMGILMRKAKDIPAEMEQPKLRDLESIAGQSSGTPVTAIRKLMSFLGIENKVHGVDQADSAKNDITAKPRAKKTDADTTITLDDLLLKPSHKKAR